MPKKANDSEPKKETDVVNDDFLVDVPDIPLPTEQDQKDIVEDECQSAFNWAFVGAGQAGSRMAEAFWKLGYRRICCVNTTSQDLARIQIPDDKKFVMDIGEGGAGKDPSKGAKAITQYYEDVYDLMRRSFGRNFERILVLIGAGGGTGTGCIEKLIQISHDIAQSFRKEVEGVPAVGALVSMPMLTEGGKTNANSYDILEKLLEQVGQGRGKLSTRTLSPLIIVDNEKINKIYPGLPVTEFWGVANQSISSLFHLFNSIAIQDSDFTTFDRADLKDIYSSGVLTLGACPIRKHEGATDISYAIRDNLRSNILVGDMDLHEAKIAGCVFIGHSDVLSNIPQEYLEHGFDMLSRVMGDSSTVHRGIYRGRKEGLVVYTILGELGRPDVRLAEIARVGGIKVNER
jgi:cell division GTPase FtsZ